jgi:antitoxin HicB
MSAVNRDMGSNSNSPNREYRMSIIADPDGGYVVEFPDLPGCMTQIESLEELAEAASEAKALWIEAALSRGLPIPEPTYPETLSGKFNVRLPKSLHRALVDQAEAEGVSLNQLVVFRLSSSSGDRSDVERLHREVIALRERIDSIRGEVASLNKVHHDWITMVAKTSIPLTSRSSARQAMHWKVIRTHSAATSASDKKIEGLNRSVAA